MTWTKLSDDFSDDCWELSDAAVRLHMEGLVWSNRKLLDCRLVKDEMVRWAKRPGAAEELVAAGWWRDDDTVYLIVHHAIYQRAREAVLKQQDANQKNGQKGGLAGGAPACHIVAAALAHWKAAQTSPPQARHTLVPMVDKPDRGGDDGFLDLMRVPF